MDVVSVTGTRIKGATTPSPLISIDEAQVREEGYSDLGEVIRSIPQNFSGGQNPGVALGSGSIANQNINSGSALNLRGLGPDARSEARRVGKEGGSTCRSRRAP